MMSFRDGKRFFVTVGDLSLFRFSLSEGLLGTATS